MELLGLLGVVIWFGMTLLVAIDLSKGRYWKEA